jgi:hypothetical protein
MFDPVGTCGNSHGPSGAGDLKVYWPGHPLMHREQSHFVFSTYRV